MPPARTPTAPEWGRVCAVAVLLALGAIGVRTLAELWTPPAADRPSAPALIAFAALEAAALALAVAALRRPPERPVFGRWTRALSAGFVLIVVVAPVVMLLAAAHKIPGVGDPFPLPPAPTPPAGTVPPGPGPVRPPSAPPVQPRERSPGDVDWTAVPVLLAFAVVALLAWAVVRRFPGTRPAITAPAGPPPAAGFEEAAAAGSRALLSTGDPRAAVIACYTAMEDVLAEAGAAPHRSDTPGEVLARASGAGLAGLDAAATLTRLFREARYSVHPVTERHRAEALAALESLRAGSRS